MEKLIYILGQPEGQSVEDLFEALTKAHIPALIELGAKNIRACVRDSHVAPAEPLRGGQLAGELWCYLALWVNSRVLHTQIEELLAPSASFVYGYAVAESEHLFHEYANDGSRVDGMNEVVMFRKPEGVDRPTFLQTWLHSHTQIAIETQSTFGYVQNIVGDTLDENAPWFDAIVEENFPDAAMTSPEAFYDAVGNTTLYQEREK
ncbi:MAG: hypothetical protein AAGF46_11670, partial [Pseudomonadota bacterium]